MMTISMNDAQRIEAILRSRACFRPQGPWQFRSPEAEGGCGVTGFAATIPVGGKHIYEPSIQMRNRGNGKGGGIAACGLVADDLGVSQKVLDEDYILQVALLDPSAREEVEKECIEPFFQIDQGGLIPTVDDYRDVELLEVRPPDVARYFVRVKPEVLSRFAEEKGLSGLSEREVEDEFVSQNSTQLNKRFYASLGDKRAFVLSHARNLIIVKIVGYAEAAVQYYRMPDMKAHVWIAHQRYPTKGRVWHPGGAHPFIGLNEALVHNGDFANYHSVTEYLAGRNIFPQFLTDTEVSVLLFDLWNRIYGYPVEYIIEALAPTTEMDFDQLPAEKQAIYRQIQAAHIHASPDGPWFFIIARSLAQTKEFQLLGITDTAMLRPQVFALQEGEVSIGLICSEKQAIDATLASLAAEDPRFTPVADMYWNARGGSHTDGGAFLLTVSPRTPHAPREDGRHAERDEYDSGKAASSNGHARYTLRVTDKFGKAVATPSGQTHCNLSLPPSIPAAQSTPHAPREDARHAERDEYDSGDLAGITAAIAAGYPEAAFRLIQSWLAEPGYDRFRVLVQQWANRTAEKSPALGIEALTLGIDRRYPTLDKKRSSVLTILRQGLERIFSRQPLIDQHAGGTHCRVTWDTRGLLRAPQGAEEVLLIDARRFAPEGPDCDAVLAVKAFGLGWRRLVHFNTRGTRFHAAGFGPRTDGLRIDCYDNPGDYLGSGMDGLEVHVHGNAQDQLCQITKRGKLVVYGDVGQTFLYGAKGGEIYVLGSAAGRPMINAVGAPRVIINGTALDFLAESFMAGDPRTGGGFAIVNGLKFDHQGRLIPLETPYPGSNLLSLASGGAIYVRDPHRRLVDEQLNGGAYRPLGAADWKLIRPYLEENQRLFDVQIERDLLTVDGVVRSPFEVYRKVMPRKDAEAEAELEGMGE
jgi:glutamate synthase domain-containing protein 1/glutamate synthase domain-containing protein 3